VTGNIGSKCGAGSALLAGVHEEHLAVDCRLLSGGRLSGIMTFSSVLLQEQFAVILLLKMALVSLSPDMDEHGEHKDLRGSGRRSVIPYVHIRMKLYCSSLTLSV
jgi:hypothetical protein